MQRSDWGCTVRTYNRCGGPRGWNPLVDHTPVFWMDATYGITTVSGKVSQWDSRVGSASFVQSVSGARPDYSATGWNSAKPAVLFGTTGGSPGYTDLRSSHSATANIWNVFTLLVTVQYTAASATQFVITSDDGSGVPFGYGLTSANKERLDLHAGGADILGNTVTTGNYRVWLGRNNVTPANASTLNRVGSISDGADGSDVTNPNTRTVLGGQAVLGINQLQGPLVEIIGYDVYDTTLSEKYYEYSVNKWGG